MFSVLWQRNFDVRCGLLKVVKDGMQGLEIREMQSRPHAPYIIYVTQEYAIKALRRLFPFKENKVIETTKEIAHFERKK